MKKGKYFEKLSLFYNAWLSMISILKTVFWGFSITSNSTRCLRPFFQEKKNIKYQRKLWVIVEFDIYSLLRAMCFCVQVRPNFKKQHDILIIDNDWLLNDLHYQTAFWGFSRYVLSILPNYLKKANDENNAGIWETVAFSQAFSSKSWVLKRLCFDVWLSMNNISLNGFPEAL